MTLSAQIIKYIPTAIASGIAMQTIDTIGNHFISEILLLKLQRPTPAPTPVIPITAIGSNFSKCIDLVDADIEQYNKTKTEEQPEITFNPWNDTRFISYHTLVPFVQAYENNLIGLIAYYNTPNPSSPPPGYPTSPIPKPLTIPTSPSPALVPETIASYIENNIQSNLATMSPPAVLTPQVDAWINGWADFLVSEVFV